MDFGRWFHLPWAVALPLNLVGLLYNAGLALLTIKLAFRQLKRHRHMLAGADLHAIDRMSGEQFETFLTVLFERLGYQAEVTGRFDKGADLILTREGIRTAVQAKCWQQPVGVEAVRAVVAALRPYHCTRGMVVTNSTVTRSARQAARENNIELWDRTDLANVLLAAREPGRPLPLPGFAAWLLSEPRQVPGSAPPSPQPASNYICATCGRQVTKGVRRFCRDQPERFGGMVYCMDHQYVADSRRNGRQPAAKASSK
jgi:restriction system protein